MFFKLYKYLFFRYVFLQYKTICWIYGETRLLCFLNKACFTRRIILFTSLGHSAKGDLDKIQITSLKMLNQCRSIVLPVRTHSMIMLDIAVFFGFFLSFWPESLSVNGIFNRKNRLVVYHAFYQIKVLLISYKRWNLWWNVQHIYILIN